MIIVDNGHWKAMHDLSQGGALISVCFHKGRNGNILVGPIAMGVGDYQDIHEAHPHLQVHEGEDEVELTFTGKLCNTSGPSQFGYAQSWIYRSYGAHRTQQIYGDIASMDPRTLVLGHIAVGKQYPHVLLELRRQSWHDGLREEIKSDSTPSSFGFFADTGEGIQFLRGDDIGAWGYDPATRTTSFGEFLCVANDGVLQATLKPFANLQAPTLSGYGTESLGFDSFVGISNYKARPYLPYVEVSVTSQPFPSDAEIRAFHELGVNVLRIHEGANFVNQTIDHWMDGNFPPYAGLQLTEMKRLIRTAHMYGMKVIPYFMPGGVHPTSEAFRFHGREWQRMGIPNQMVRFSALGDGQVWETYLCLESEWRNWLLEHVSRIVEEYGFDGIYFDSPGGLAPCYNPQHARIPHACESAFLRLLMDSRKRFPGKLIFHHQMTLGVDLLRANIVDHIINFEEYGLKMPEEMRQLPFGFIAQRACASVAPTPQLFLPKDGEALTPALAMVKYKPGKNPTITRKYARQGFPYFIVHGALPYLYTFMEGVTLGYRTVQDRLDDNEGFYYFYKLLKPLGDFIVKDYYAPEEEALIPSADGIECAVLITDKGLVVLLTSTRVEEIHNVRLETCSVFCNVLTPETWERVSIVASTHPAEVTIGKGSDGMPNMLMNDISPNELYVILIECALLHQ